MLLARQSWKWVVRSRHINVRHCDVKVSSLTTYPPLEQITPTFWRKDKRSKNVAMIEQFWLRDTHLPPGETTRGRAFDVVPSPIVSQWELMRISIGVPDARGVKKQRMVPAKAKEGTVFHRDVGESHWRMFRSSFPGWWGSTIWLRPYVTDTHFPFKHRIRLQLWENACSRLSEWAQSCSLFTSKLPKDPTSDARWSTMSAPNVWTRSREKMRVFPELFAQCAGEVGSRYWC